MYHWSSHKKAAPIHFAQCGSRKEKLSMTNQKNQSLSQILKGQHRKRIVHSKCCLYTTGPTADRGSGDIN